MQHTAHNTSFESAINTPYARLSHKGAIDKKVVTEIQPKQYKTISDVIADYHTKETNVPNSLKETPRQNVYWEQIHNTTKVSLGKVLWVH